MYMLYVDDSGSPNDPGQQYFVLGGLAVFERQPHWIGQKLDAIAARFNPADPLSVELHGSPMVGGKGRWRTSPQADRINAIRDALSVLAESHVSNRVFCVAVRKTDIFPRDPVEFAFEQLCLRFDHFLMRMHKAKDTQRGLIIFDKSTRETTIQRLATDFRTIGHSFGQVRNLAEVPVFLDSRASRLVQMADLIAYATFRHFEHGDSQFFDIFKHRFDHHAGVCHGLYTNASTVSTDDAAAKTG